MLLKLLSRTNNSFRPHLLKPIAVLLAFNLINSTILVGDGVDKGIKVPARLEQLQVSHHSISSRAISATGIEKATPLASDTLQPVFPGGYMKLGEYIGTHYMYPINDLAFHLSGYVLLQTDINETGKMEHFKVLKASQGVFAAELVRALRDMPHWEPAYIYNKPVRARYILPVMFKVANREEPEVDQEFKKTLEKFKSKSKRSKDLTFIPDPINVIINLSPPPIDYSEVTDSAHLVLRKPIYVGIEYPPKFPGGDAALEKFIALNLRVTPEATANNVHGEIIASFVVDDDGTVRFPEVSKKLGYGLDEEVLRVIRLFPKFEPGIQNKKAVAYRYRLPFYF